MDMLHKPKILVVEDEIIVAVNLGQKLKKLGYELVGITSSGEEAIQKAEENHPDLEPVSKLVVLLNRNYLLVKWTNIIQRYRMDFG
ncbi:response regulator receiver domain protein, partial [Leptospira kirschneri serovar Bim str. PUO 1247]